MRVPFVSHLSLCLAIASCVAGCGTGDRQFESLRSRFVLAEEPKGAVGIAEVPEHLDPGQEVVVVGRIANGEFDPWAKDQAAFVISEAPLAADGHTHAAGHDPASCPFCRRRAEKASATALVQFHDEHGVVLPIDATSCLA